MHKIVSVLIYITSNVSLAAQWKDKCLTINLKVFGICVLTRGDLIHVSLCEFQMIYKILFLFFHAIAAVPNKDILIGKFPKDFGWGACSSSYQTEGAWDEDGKKCISYKRCIL